MAAFKITKPKFQGFLGFDRGREIHAIAVFVLFVNALIGFRGREIDKGVQPDFCHPLHLETLIFSKASKMS
jgi:hypothetical protein